MLPVGETISLFVFVVSWRIQMLYLPLNICVYATYLPSGEIAAMLLCPLSVNLSILSGRFATRSARFLLEALKTLQKMNPPDKTTMTAAASATTSLRSSGLRLVNLGGRGIGEGFFFFI